MCEFVFLLSLCVGVMAVMVGLTSLVFYSIGDLLLRCKDPPLMYTDLEHDGITIDVTWRSNVEDSSGSFDRKLTLTEFARSALDERNETSTDEYLFLQHQLRLFGDLCLGRHEVNILTITGQPVKEATYRALLTWSECFAVVASRSATEASDHSPGIKRPELQRSIRNQPINPPDNLLPRSLRCVYVDLVRIAHDRRLCTYTSYQESIAPRRYCTSLWTLPFPLRELLRALSRIETF